MSFRFIPIIAILLMVGKCWSAAPVTYTVCAAGCSQTTLSGAYAAMAAGDIIQINDNSVTNEAFQVAKNITIQGLNSSIIWAGASIDQVANSKGFMFILASGALATIRNLTINRNQAGVTTTSNFVNIGSGTLTLTNVRIINSITGAGNLLVRNTGGKVVSSGSIFTSTTASDGVSLAGIQSGSFTNCLFSGLTNAISSGADAPVTVLNCDFVRNSIGVSFGSTTGAVTNTLFVNNTNDAYLNSSSFDYCLTASAITGAGANCVTGATLANTFCHQTNYWLSSSSLARNAGISILPAGTIGLNNVLHGWYGGYDLGCNPYTPALCGASNQVGNTGPVGFPYMGQNR
jgi:hypothetical protein